MRKLILALSVPTIALVLLGADIRRTGSPNVPTSVVKKKCLGYTIIEFGKGIDCNGDTVKLVRLNGVQVLASASE